MQRKDYMEMKTLKKKTRKNRYHNMSEESRQKLSQYQKKSPRGVFPKELQQLV